MLEFIDKHWLYLLILPPVIAFFFTTKKSKETAPQDTSALIHSQAALLIQLSQKQHRRKRFPWWWVAGCMLLITALAQPQWLSEALMGEHSGRDIILLIDVSGSMRAQDFIIDNKPASRLTLLKRHLKTFLAARSNDRIGIIVFADHAMTYLPVTTDINMATQLLDGIDQGIAGERTALGDAIALGVDRIKTQNPDSGVLILLTDGSNTAGNIDPEAASRYAVENNVRIYSVGIGSNKDVLFPRGPLDKPLLAQLPLDEPLLKTIAANTNGKYYLANSSLGMQTTLDDIDQLEPVKQLTPHYAKRDPLYWLPLLIGLILLLLDERSKQASRLS